MTYFERVVEIMKTREDILKFRSLKESQKEAKVAYWELDNENLNLDN